MPKATVETFCGVAMAKEDMIRHKFGQYFVLSILAGMYIGFGILLIFTVGAQFASASSVATKVIMGTSFGIALTLVIFSGSELFTGNNMVMVIGCLKGKTGWGWMIWLWFVCYFANLVGALFLSALMSQTGLADMGGKTGDFINKVAGAKMNGAWWQLFFRGILCNMLVCLAVWMCTKAKNEAARIFCIWWCLYAFISCGFEHSIANMTIFGVALFTGHPDTVSVGGFVHNQIAVTLGNILGGAFFGLVYWFATWVPEDALLSSSATDGGTSTSLLDSAQGTKPGLCVIGTDENDNEIYGTLPSCS